MNLIRGDTLKLKFQRLNSDNEPINPFLNPANVYFTVKKSANKQDFLFQKKFLIDGNENTITIDGQGIYHFIIKPEDTDNLSFGVYEYDLEVITEEYKQTIARGKLGILEEITRVANEV